MYEQGKREPSHEMLLKLSEYFKVSVDELLGNETLTEPLPKDFETNPVLLFYYDNRSQFTDSDDEIIIGILKAFLNNKSKEKSTDNM